MLCSELQTKDCYDLLKLQESNDVHEIFIISSLAIAARSKIKIEESRCCEGLHEEISEKSICT